MIFYFSKTRAYEFIQDPATQSTEFFAAEEVLEDLRPRPQRYADRTWMPPRGTRRSMGKR